MKKFFLSISLSVVGLFIFSPAFAKPPLKPYAALWPERGSKLYNFQVLSFTSIDQARHYQVWVATPKKASNQPTSVLYLLDGNVALQLAEDHLLDKKASLPVLVFIGYKDTIMFNRESRTYDYTPAVVVDGYTGDDPDNNSAAGGAQHFLQLINEQIKPAVNKMVTIDPSRQALWGHSYGGLFVLSTLFNAPQSFQHYYAADPSLWWHQGFILSQLEKLQHTPLTKTTTITMIMGKGKTTTKKEIPAAKARSYLSADKKKAFIKQLMEVPLLHVNYQQQALSHGELFKSSLYKTLQQIQQNQ